MRLYCCGERQVLARSSLRAPCIGSASGVRPFVRSTARAPRCATQSELFGYEKGAFTGAAARKPGRAELAEAAPCPRWIGDITPAVQVKPFASCRTARTSASVGPARSVPMSGSHRDHRNLEENGEGRPVS